jgi:hypothetical protein
VRVRWLRRVSVAGEDREPGILGKAMVCKREIAEDEDGTSSRFDAAGMQAIGAEAGVEGTIRLLLRTGHESKDSAVCGAVIVRMKCRAVVSWKESRMRIAVRIAAAGLGLLVMGSNGRGQTADPPQSTPQTQQAAPAPDEITAVPNRPTFASTAEMVQLGVFEIEYGFEAAKGHQNVNGLLKWGVVKNLELWFLNIPLESDAGTAGLGDFGTGFKYKLIAQTKKLPRFSVLYILTLPTARPALGAGATGHSIQLLASKDLGKHHFDVNEGVQFVGRPGASGFDHNYFTALSYSRQLTPKWGYTAEIAGYSRTNAMTPATMTLLGAATYNVSSRLVLDGGAYYAVYGQLPRVTFIGGATYSVGDFSPRHSHRQPVRH